LKKDQPLSVVEADPQIGGSTQLYTQLWNETYPKHRINLQSPVPEVRGNLCLIFCIVEVIFVKMINNQIKIIN